MRAAATTAGLTEVESAALAAYKGAHKAELSHCLDLLRTAAKQKSVAPEIVEGALIFLEQATPQKGPRSIDGTWRLVFGTATKLRFFQYIPVDEDFKVDLAGGTLALVSVIGPFGFNIKGKVFGWEAQSGVLDFQFNEVDVSFNGSKIWTTQPKTKRKTYTFYHVEGDVAAARSSAGGVALLRK